MEFKEFYALLTLVDITRTNEYRAAGKSRNQQRNYDTLVQTVGLYTQPHSIQDPITGSIDKIHKRYSDKFGEKHRVIRELFNVDHNIWLWQFGVEQDGVLGENARFLADALHNTPAISGLDENCIMEPSVFATHGENKNTFIMRVTS